MPCRWLRKAGGPRGGLGGWEWGSLSEPDGVEDWEEKELPESTARLEAWATSHKLWKKNKKSASRSRLLTSDQHRNKPRVFSGIIFSQHARANIFHTLSSAC